MGKNKAKLPHFHVCIRYMFFDSTHAPVATAARAAATGLVSMSTRPDTPGMLHLERVARDWSTYNEYSYRIILLLLLHVYCSRAHPHFPSQFRGPCRIFLPLLIAQTQQNPDGKAIYFFMRKASKFLETYFRKHSNKCVKHHPPTTFHCQKPCAGYAGGRGVYYILFSFVHHHKHFMPLRQNPGITSAALRIYAYNTTHTLRSSCKQE